MNIKFKHKSTFVSVIFATLMLSACGDRAASTQISSQDSSAPVIETKGNWNVKSKDLSSHHKADIQSDLLALNRIVNGMNSESVVLRDEVVKAKNDQNAIKEILEKSQKIQQKGAQDLMDLTLKSSEVQVLRTKMIENLTLTYHMYELSNQPDFQIEKPSDELKKLALRSQTLQQEISTELQRLNSEYK